MTWCATRRFHELFSFGLYRDRIVAQIGIDIAPEHEARGYSLDINGEPLCTCSCRVAPA